MGGETVRSGLLLRVLCSFGKTLRDKFSSSLNEHRIEFILSLGIKHSSILHRRNSIQSERKPPLTVCGSQGRLWDH